MLETENNKIDDLQQVLDKQSEVLLVLHKEYVELKQQAQQVFTQHETLNTQLQSILDERNSTIMYK